MKILITGFDPFNNASINPSYEAVKLLPDKILDKEITKLLIPTSFKRSFLTLKAVLDKNNFDAVILVGQAGGRAGISIEKVAINYMDANIADNDGFIAKDSFIYPNEREAYFSTLPLIKMKDELLKNNISAHISYTAGSFVCNYLLYNTLRYTLNTNTKACFIHVPFLDTQATINNHTYPSMTLEEIVKALELLIKAI